MIRTVLSEDAKSIGLSSSKSCRFLSAPFAECYCVDITSAKIPKLIKYCAGAFASCPIYCGKTGKRA